MTRCIGPFLFSAFLLRSLTMSFEAENFHVVTCYASGIEFKPRADGACHWEDSYDKSTAHSYRLYRYDLQRKP